MADIRKREVRTDKALHSGAFYSQAIVTGNLVFVAGQVPVDPATGQVKGNTVFEQTCTVLESVQAILQEAGSGLQDVVRMTCFLADLHQFTEMNRAFERYFQPPYPARATVGVQLIGFDVEIECTAVVGCGNGGDRP